MAKKRKRKTLEVALWRILSVTQMHIAISGSGLATPDFQLDFVETVLLNTARECDSVS